MLQFKCPACSTAISAEPRYAGAKFPCPSCGQRLQVPRSLTVLGEPLEEENPLRASPRKAAAWYTVGGSAVPAIVLAIIVAILLAVVGTRGWNAFSLTLVEQQVAVMISEKDGVKVNSVSLVKKTANEYEGFVTTTTGREGTVFVTYDGNRVLARWLWKDLR